MEYGRDLFAITLTWPTSDYEINNIMDDEYQIMFFYSFGSQLELIKTL